MESLNSNSKEREMQLTQRLVKQRHSHCMAWFEQLETHLRDLYLNSSPHAVDAFKPAFHSFFGEEHQTFRLKMFRNLDQLRLQLEKENLLELDTSQKKNLHYSTSVNENSNYKQHGVFGQSSKKLEVNLITDVKENWLSGRLFRKASLGLSHDKHDTSRSCLRTYFSHCGGCSYQTSKMTKMRFAEVKCLLNLMFLAIVTTSYEQSEPIYDTYLLEKVDSNTTPDSANMCHRGGEIDQDDDTSQAKRVMKIRIVQMIMGSLSLLQDAMKKHKKERGIIVAKVQSLRTRNINKLVEPKSHTQKPGRQIAKGQRCSPITQQCDSELQMVQMLISPNPYDCVKTLNVSAGPTNLSAGPSSIKEMKGVRFKCAYLLKEGILLICCAVLSTSSIVIMLVQSKVDQPSSEESSSRIVIPTNVHSVNQPQEHIEKWTKDHPLDKIIELHEFKHLEIWELVPRPDQVMIITLKWIYKVKLDELGGVLKNKANQGAKGKWRGWNAKYVSRNAENASRRIRRVMVVSLQNIRGSHMSRRFFGILSDHRQYLYWKNGETVLVLATLIQRKNLQRFVGPFEIIEKVGPVAYRFDFPEELNGVHDTFHVSNLKKCLADPTLQVPLDDIRVDVKLNFVEEPVEILEREFKKLKRSRIAIVKVWWNSKRGPEFTWERADR
ncbi:hypothetical protein Tco_0295935 [Tanacetum coccineum]